MTQRLWGPVTSHTNRFPNHQWYYHSFDPLIFIGFYVGNAASMAFLDKRIVTSRVGDNTLLVFLLFVLRSSIGVGLEGLGLFRSF